MTERRVSMWKCAALDGQTMRVRKEAWEVVHPAQDGKGSLCCTLFTGPFAEQRARRYYDLVRADYDGTTGAASTPANEPDLSEFF